MYATHRVPRKGPLPHPLVTSNCDSDLRRVFDKQNQEKNVSYQFSRLIDTQLFTLDDAMYTHFYVPHEYLLACNHPECQCLLVHF